MNKDSKVCRCGRFIMTAIVFGTLCTLLCACQCRHEWEETTVPSSCLNAGVIYQTCSKCGEVVTLSDLPAAGHTFGEWSTVTDVSTFVNGELQRTCAVCGEIETEIVRCETADIPRLNIIGSLDGIEKDTEVTVRAEYASDDVTFSCTATLEWQGASSLSYDKKNYNLRLYRDDTLDKKYKVDLGWGTESKYCLKANYIDATQSRNIVTARLWGQMVAARDNVPEELASSPNGGAIDGFPIILLHDGEFLGLYTLNIPKDEWMFNIGKNDTGAVLCADNWDNACKWYTADAVDGENWSIKYESDDLEDTTLARLNEAIAFVNEIYNAGSATKEQLEKLESYVDVDSAIDYMILMYVSCASDNTSKNAILVTYDGLKFYYSPYDLDSTWSLHWTGTEYYEVDELLPRVSTAGTELRPEVSNRLFYLIGKYYPEKFVARYFSLRETVLSQDNILAQFRQFINEIPENVTAMERAAWPDIPSTDTNTYGRIAEYVKKRLPLLDEIIGAVNVD